MKPLQSAAMGFVVVLLYARFNGYDAYADPVGWLLVLVGLRRLPDAVPLRGAATYAGTLALLVAVPLWFPGPRDVLADQDPSLAWAADLPAFACAALLCQGLARAAHGAGEERVAKRFDLVRTVLVVVALVPVLVFGAGLEGLAAPAALAAQLAYLALVWMLFSVGSRPWAGGPILETAPQPPATS